MKNKSVIFIPVIVTISLLYGCAHIKPLLHTDKQDSTKISEQIPAYKITDFINVTQSTKGIQIYGWGEYRAAGKCICCDNILDGDCIVISNIERTEKMPLKYLIDGEKPEFSEKKDGFFGELMRRTEQKYVNHLYIRITLPKEKEISEVKVWTQKKNNRSLLDNCELGYIDYFDRLMWIEKIEENKFSEFISFNISKHIKTKELLLRISGGQNRVTEVEIFAKN